MIKYGESSEISPEYDELSETKKNNLRQIRSDNHISAALIAEKLSQNSRAVEKNILQLHEDGFLLRKGLHGEGIGRC